MPPTPVRAALLALALLPAPPASAQEPEPQPLQVVSPAALRRAMAPEAAAGYDLTATTNQARFHAAVIVALAREALQRAPEGPPLLVPPETWFRVYMDLIGRPDDEAPTFVALSRRYGQRRLVEYRSERVIERVLQGEEPELALAVWLFWPEEGSLGSKFSFRDELSVPRLAVSHHRELGYRLLVYPDQVVFDGIEGLTGRPTSGSLAFLFRLLGEGTIEWTRQALTADGLQIHRTRAHKAFFNRTATITVWPDGVAARGLPEDRSDLAPVERRLMQPLEIDYHPMPPLPDAERLAELEAP